MLKNTLLSAIIINLLILPILPISALGGTLFQLPPAVIVNESNPKLKSIVKLISTTESSTKIDKVLNQQIILGLKPAQYTVLTKSKLERNLALALKDFQIQSYDTVKVTRKGYSVTINELALQAKRFLHNQLVPLAEDIVIELVSDIPDVYVSEQNYTLSFKRNLDNQFLKRTCVWATIKTSKNSKTVPIWFSVTLKQHAWVLSQTQQANNHFHQSQVTRQIVDIANTPVAKLVKNPKLLKYRYKRSLPAGTVLLTTHLEELPAVEKNAVTLAKTTHSGITIKTYVKALQDGNINQRIKVQSLSSGENFYGIVINTNMIHVIN